MKDSYIFKRRDIQISELIQRDYPDYDLLLNHATKETIPESLLSVYDIHAAIGESQPIYTLIIPTIVVNQMRKEKFNTCEKDCEIHKGFLRLDKEEYKKFEHTRFTIDKYTYIGNASDDIIIEKYSSQIIPFDNDSDLAIMLKNVLSSVTHIVNNDPKKKDWLTQLYSRIRRTESPVEDRNSLYSKLKLLEQFSEGGLYLTSKVRGADGRLEDITFPFKI